MPLHFNSRIALALAASSSLVLLAGAPIALAAPTAAPTPSVTATTSPTVKPSPTATTTPPTKPSPTATRTSTTTPKPTASSTPNKPAAARFSVSVQAPQSLTGPALLYVTGAEPGVRVEAAAGRNSQAQAETIGSGVTDSRGRAVIALPPPGGRWPANSTYLWGLSLQQGGDGHRQGTFRTPGSSSAPGSHASTKDNSGGLAKTGV